MKKDSRYYMKPHLYLDTRIALINKIHELDAQAVKLHARQHLLQPYLLRSITDAIADTESEQQALQGESREETKKFQEGLLTLAELPLKLSAINEKIQKSKEVQRNLESYLTIPSQTVQVAIQQEQALIPQKRAYYLAKLTQNLTKEQKERLLQQMTRYYGDNSYYRHLLLGDAESHPKVATTLGHALMLTPFVLLTITLLGVFGFGGGFIAGLVLSMVLIPLCITIPSFFDDFISWGVPNFLERYRGRSRDAEIGRLFRDTPIASFDDIAKGIETNVTAKATVSEEEPSPGVSVKPAPKAHTADVSVVSGSMFRLQPPVVQTNDTEAEESLLFTAGARR